VKEIMAWKTNEEMTQGKRVGQREGRKNEQKGPYKDFDLQ